MARAAVLSAVRRWFEGQGFLEVETPTRVLAPGQEFHLHAISAPADGTPRFLITSPEYAMKRLCGAGFERIVSIGKCWRAGEQGPHHQSEFTMIEWYRAHAPLADLARDCEQLLRLASETVAAQARAQTQVREALRRSPSLQLGHSPAALQAPFVRTTVRELVRRHAGIDLRGDESVDELGALARSVGVAVGVAPARPAAWDDIFFQLWLDRIEPALAASPTPTFVFDWPVPLAALARAHVDDPRIAERFELYAGGLELANAFGELTDPDEQRRRFVAESHARRAAGKVTYPLDEHLLAALGRMPPTSGIALGFDRLMMFTLGEPEIRNVVAFADDEV